LARNTPGTVDEARALWQAVDRPNVFIKVPATAEGLPAIRDLIDDGINVNVTLIFSLSRYQQVANAYIDGLEMRAARHEPPGRVMSVASFFLSRIDVAVDPLLARLADRQPGDAAQATELRGQTAVALAKVAYQMYLQIFGSSRFSNLAVAIGARPQRLLWASTGTKNPDDSDVKYVEPLIGPETVTTMPLETLEAYRDHGNPAPRLEEHLGRAYETLASVANVGIDLAAVSAQLEREGIEKFSTPFDHLLGSLNDKIAALTHGG
jgi:transaldolase